MKNTLRRTLVALLALTMIFMSIPIFVSSAQTSVKVGDIVEFGSYPQSKVTDSSLKSKLTSLAGPTNYWTSYGYYSGSGSYSDGKMTAKDYMKYTDVTYNGAKYRGVYFTEYRPYRTGYTSSSTNQDNNGYSTSTQYWFRFDPIKWRVLDPSTGLVMAETILDSQAYNNYLLYSSSECYGDASKTYYANNWEHSSIRKWLNNDFLNTAFSTEEQNNIKETTLSTPAYSTSYSKYDSADTLDKVFLLSYTDVQNTDYGFENSTSSSDTRTAQGSSYAKCQGLYVYSGNGNSWWRLRSGGSYSSDSCSVNNSGYVYGGYDTGDAVSGVRPALLLQSLNPVAGSECEHSYKTTVTPATCTEKGYTTHTCTKCSDSYTDTYTNALGHVYDDGVITVNPTCTDKGVKTFTCTRTGCTASYTEEIEALGHNWGEWTSNEDGTHTRLCKNNTAHVETADCTEDNAEIEVFDAHCDKDGYTVYTCKDCGYEWTVVDEGSAPGHNYGDWTKVADENKHMGYCLCEFGCNSCTLKDCYDAEPVYTEAVCGKNAYYTYTCDKCGNVWTEEDEDTALEHEWVKNEDLSSDPTCLKHGFIVYDCALCNARKTDVVSHLGHDFVVIDTDKAATCTENGYAKLSKCQREDCGFEQVEGEIEALGHDFTEQIIDDAHLVTPADCENAAVYKYDCSRCDAIGEDTFEYGEALGHVVVVDEAKEATCTETGLTEGSHCDRCGKILVAQEVIPAKGHTEVTDAAVEATCTESGLTEGKHCSDCKAVLVAQEEIPALGHDIVKHDAKVPTCTEIGWDAYDTCSRCDYTTYVEKPVLGHTEAEAVKENEVAATTKAIGSYDSVVYCSVCGVKLSSETVVIDKIPEIKIDVKSNDHLALVNGILVIDKTVTEKDIFDNTNATQIVNADDTENTDGVLKTEMKANVFTGAELTDSIAMALLGDVDCDGDVDVADARLALRAAVKLDILVGARFAAADVDFSNDISVSDARTILRIAVKLEDGTDLIAKRKAD